MKKNILLLIICLGLFSCSKTHELFDTNRVKEESKENFPTQDIDPDHDWNMAGMKSLAVTVNQTEGENYTIWIYTNDPFRENSTARLLKEGVNIENGSRKLISFDAATALDLIYVVCEDKNHGYTMKPVAFTDSKAEIVFGTQLGKSARSISATVDFSSRALPTFLGKDEAAALPETSGNNTGGSYKITQNGTVWCGANTNLYVLGNVTLSYNWMAANSWLIILPGSKVTFSNKLDINGGNVIIYDGGELIANEGVDLNQDKQLYNCGIIRTSNVNVHGGSFINDINATVEVAGTTYFNSSACVWENTGSYHTKDVDIVSGGASLVNKCKLIVDESLNMPTSGAKLTVDGGASVKCRLLYMDNATIEMGAALVEVTEKATFQYGNTIRVSTGTAVLKMKQAISKTLAQGNVMTYSGDLGIDCNNHFENGLSGNVLYYKLENGANFIKGNLKYSISSSNCSDGYNPTPGVLPDASQIYTYAFEDITTKGGDYDFNDVVLKVETVPVDNKLKVSLVAAGAQKNLKVYYNAGKSSEKILFGGKEVHEALGGAAGEIINTTGQRDKYSPVDDYIPYQEGKSLSEYGDFSIYDMDNRMYVRLPNRYFNDDFNRGDVPYAIMVPIDWYYPDEHQRIDNRYNFFKGWAENKDKYTLWYTQNSWEDSNTYPYDDK